MNAVDPEKSVPAGGLGDVSRPAMDKSPSRVRRMGLWVSAAAVCYGLTLAVLTDSFVIVAIPGLIGLVTLGSMAGLWLMYRPLGDSSPPYATDGSDHRGAVQHHRSVLLKRYATLVIVCIALAASLPVTKSDYLIPLAPLAVMSLLMGTRYWLEQVRWIRRSSRVLDVYGFTFRAPVQTLNLRSAGKRSLRLGRDGDECPKMSGHQPLGNRWPKDIAEGVWFAGDDVFGGVLLVPGSGELMCIQPLNWDELAGERSRAGAERLEKAKHAGLDKHFT